MSKINEYIKKNGLQAVTNELFDELEVNNQGPMNDVFSNAKGLYIDPEDYSDDDPCTDTVYDMMNFPKGSPVKVMNFIMEVASTADDTEVVAVDGNKILVKYWWD